MKKDAKFQIEVNESKDEISFPFQIYIPSGLCLGTPMIRSFGLIPRELRSRGQLCWTLAAPERENGLQARKGWMQDFRKGAVAVISEKWRAAQCAAVKMG